jgi:hypothetical protein
MADPAELELPKGLVSNPEPESDAGDWEEVAEL